MDERAIGFYSNIAYLYSTRLQPLALAITLSMAIVLLLVPKKFASIPILVVMFSISHLQSVVVGGFYFSMVRLMIIFGFLRVILRAEHRSWKHTGLDSAILIFGFSQIFFYTVQKGSINALSSSLGQAFEIFGLYFLFRMLIVDISSGVVAVRAIALLAIPIAVEMLIEQHTGRNSFSIFGVNQNVEMRFGRLRSQAAFAQPILAGTFGATTIPLLLGIWRMDAASKKCAIAGIVSAVICAATSSSSGPVFALVMGIAAVFIWQLSPHMREVRWIALLGIIGLQLLMKSPVYALLARLPSMQGSTGYYRFILYDAFVRNFKDWWLVGFSSTYRWGEGLFDVTSEYINVATEGDCLRSSYSSSLSPPHTAS